MRQLLKNLRLMTAMGLLTCGAVTHAAQINQAPERLFQADIALQALETLDHEELNNIKGGLVGFSSLNDNQVKILIGGVFGSMFGGLAANYAIRFPKITNSHANSLNIVVCNTVIGGGVRSMIAQSLLSNARNRDLELGIADVASMGAYSVMVGFAASACTYGIGKLDESISHASGYEALALDKQQTNRTQNLGASRRSLLVNASDDNMLFQINRVQEAVNNSVWCASTGMCNWSTSAIPIRDRMYQLANQISWQVKWLDGYFAHPADRVHAAKYGVQRLRHQGNVVLQPVY